MTLLAGVVLGSVGTVGAMRADGGKRYRQVNERVVRASSERSETMGQLPVEERRVCDHEVGGMGAGAILAAFGFGLLAGAVATLLTTPEPGASIRRRVKRGVETAKHEFDEVVGETKESWNRVRDDAQDAAKRTATKIKEAAKVTKDAMAEGMSSAPKT
jgi:gas vesicle protein